MYAWTRLSPWPRGAGKKRARFVVLINHSCVQLIEFGTAFTAYTKRHTRERSQVAFVSSVDEDFPAEFQGLTRLAILQPDGHNPVALANRFTKAVSWEGADPAGVRDHLLKNTLGHRRLVIVAVLAELEILRAFAVALHVIGANALRELAEDPANRIARFDIALSQTARCHSSEVMIVFGEGDGPPGSRRRQCSGDTPGLPP